MQNAPLYVDPKIKDLTKHFEKLYVHEKILFYIKQYGEKLSECEGLHTCIYICMYIFKVSCYPK